MARPPSEGGRPAPIGPGLSPTLGSGAGTAVHGAAGSASEATETLLSMAEVPWLGLLQRSQALVSEGYSTPVN